MQNIFLHILLGGGVWGLSWVLLDGEGKAESQGRNGQGRTSKQVFVVPTCWKRVKRGPQVGWYLNRILFRLIESLLSLQPQCPGQLRIIESVCLTRRQVLRREWCARHGAGATADGMSGNLIERQCFHSDFFHLAFDVAKYGQLWQNIILKIAKKLYT